MGLVGAAQMGMALLFHSFYKPLTLTLADYSASKAALVSLHESLRYELDKRWVVPAAMSCLELTTYHRYNAPGVRTSLVLPGHVLTPLFSTVDLPDNWFYRFLVPSLPPIHVVKDIIAVLDERHSQTIYLPFYANFVPYLRLMPSFVRDLGQWVSYVSETSGVGG